jgi:N utilization substance protein B
LESVSRRAAREKALQSLFQFDVGKVNAGDALEHVLSTQGDAGENTPYARELVQGTVEHLSDIDTVIRDHSVGWDLARMANVDRNVLRLAVYELIFGEKLPAGVVINEAVELAKQFSTEESGKFVNGVLGRILPHVDELRQRYGDPHG